MRRVPLVITAAVVAAALAAAVGAGATGRSAQSTDWPQFGFNARHSRYNPFEKVLRPAKVARLRLAWSYRTAGYGVSSPAVAGGVLYVGSGNRKVYALDASTGQKLWSYTVETLPDSLAVAGGVVYVSSPDYNLYALDASTGHKLWSYYTNGTESPTVADGVVYVSAGVNGNDMTAFDASTGQILWSHSPGKGRAAGEYSSAAVAGGTVYFTVRKVTEPSTSWVYALTASAGNELWSYRIGRPSDSSPAVAGGVVYVGSGNRKLYALDASTGHKLWSYTTRAGIPSSPAVAAGVVYIGSGHSLYALRASTGHLLWSHHLGRPGRLYSSPAVAARVVYTGSVNNRVYALDASTGHELWSYRIGRPSGSSPAVVNGKLYIGSDDHQLYAFGLAARHKRAP